ncbi:hypothetical protein APY03_7091 [Variovorax sp. WDL1]|nr:hypothetical protein APY03_7091 [Variovorax sp. WDL1]
MLTRQQWIDHLQGLALAERRSNPPSASACIKADEQMPSSAQAVPP